jgi:hypothetical protein
MRRIRRKPHEVRRLTRYIHQQAGWPKFRWDNAALAPKLADVRHRQGRLIGRIEALGFNLRAEAVLTTLTEDVLKSSEIEGEHLDREQVTPSSTMPAGILTTGAQTGLSKAPKSPPRVGVTILERMGVDILECMGAIRGICTLVIATFAIPSLVRANAPLSFATLSTTLPPLSQATS